MDSKIQGSKLSATVPAFIPGTTYTGVTSGGLSSELVIKSTLSPFVPEFRPSGSFAPLLSAPYQSTCSLLQHNSKQAYLKHQKVDLKENVSHGAHQTSFQATANKSTTKVKKPDSVEKIQESQNVSGSNSSEYLTENCANVSKKKRQKKRKQSNSLVDYQGNEEKTEGTTEKALHQEKDVSPQKVIDDMVCSKENGVTTSQPNCKSLPSSSKSTSSSEVNTKDEKANTSSTNHDSHNNKAQYPAPHLTVSFSDKVKNSSLNINSSASKRALGDKSWVKNFTVENSNKIVDAVDLAHSSKVNVDKDKRTSNLGRKKRRASNSGCLSSAPIKPLDSTSGGDGEHYQQKYCNSSNSETSNLKQIPSTGKFMGRNNSFKKNACDDDDNWRVKKEFLPVADSSTSQKIDSVKKVNTENPNVQSCKKITSHQKGEKRVMDSKKYNSDDSRKKSMDVMDKIPKTSSNQRTSSDNNGSSLTESSAKRPVTKLDSEVAIISSHEPKINQLPAASVNTASSTVAAMKGEFPDLMESTKIKRVPITDGLTIGFKETVTPSKPPATLSYSAVLRSIPKPKSVMVPAAWENEKPTTRGGLLKVPSHSGADQPESEAGQENSPTKKKKKKKKKTAESGGQSQEGGSAKRTQKPIQFDLGVMLENISKNSPEKTQQSGKKLVVATGVLPTQLSAAASSYEEKPAVISPLRKSENKIPHNKLDSTAPVIKRGKERETPARKKPSALKKIILKEREEKKKARETSESGDVETSNDSTNRACESEGENIVQQEVQDQSEAETAEEVEPSSPTDQEIAAEIHSRRFREYCWQVPDKEVDAVASELLRELVRFQDRQFHKDPIKAKAKRRFVLGLREVHKHLKLRKVKCVIISSNAERIKSAGGLDDTVGSIIRLCEENHIPVVFALKRQLLGRVLLKKVPVSIVGIFNYDGAQEYFKTLMDLTQKTKQAYDEKWQEAKEKLELQQQKTLDAKRPEMEVLSGAKVQEDVDDISQTVDKALGKENDQVYDTESSDNEERDSDEENCHVHSEEENIIVENDLEIQEL